MAHDGQTRRARQHHADLPTFPRPGAEPGRERLAVPPPELALKHRLRKLRRDRRRRMHRLAKAHRSTRNHHLHRNARLGSRRSDAMTLGINWNTSRPTDACGPVGRRSDLRRRQYRWRVRMNIRRSAMSDAALSERRAAALESSAHSNAMKAAASKTGRDRRADVWSSYPAADMEGPYAGKTWGDRRADVDSCGPAKPVQTTAQSKTWRHWRADMGNSDAGAMETPGPTKAMKTPAASKIGRDRRAEVWSSYPAAGMEGPYAGKTWG